MPRLCRHVGAQPHDLLGMWGEFSTSIACKKGLIQDTSSDLFSPAGASLSFLPYLCQLLQLISFLTAKLYHQ